MTTSRSIAAAAALLALAGPALAVDCTHFDAHKPGYCGVVSTDKKCDDAANRVPGKCSIATNAVDAGFSVAVPAGAFGPAPSGLVMSAKDVSKLPAKMVNGAQLVQLNGKWMALVASGAGNFKLVASGAGN